MSYSVELTENCEKEFKRLRKKYHSLKNEFFKLALSLEENPIQGKPLGNGFYKIRLAIASKGTGKSGGARIITYVKVINDTVFIATIYDKSEKESISQKELDLLFSEL